MLKKQLLFLLFMLAGIHFSAAQTLTPQVVSVAGTSADNGDVYLSWTIGQTVSQTFSADTLMLTQGFEQGEVSVTPISEGLKTLEADVRVYPNPVQSRLSVDFHSSGNETVRLRLMNLSGRVVLNRAVTSFSNTHEINLSQVPSGTYLLKVSVENKVKTFKVVKH